MQKKIIILLYDRCLLWLFLFLLFIGFTMVLSSSISTGQRIHNDPFFFAKRESIYIIIIFFIFNVTLSLPINFWKNNSKIILLFNLLVLVLVLITGKKINGSYRWINLGIIYIQPSEISKLSLYLYLSTYLSKNLNNLRKNIWYVLKPIIVMLIMSLLLIYQPDFGSVIVLFTTTLTILFIAGVKLWKFIFLFFLGIIFIIFLVINEPYRIKRIYSFFNPWLHPFNEGYQLTNSLIAFGRGSLLGQGIGNSLQKLYYLPEAHTDFIFSIIAEETGYLGATIVLFLIFFYLLKL